MSSKNKRIKQYEEPNYKPYIVAKCIERDYKEKNIITCKEVGCEKIIAKKYFNDYIVRSVDCTIEHIIPLSQGGSNDLDNTELLCEKCNNDRAKTPKKIKQAHKSGYELACMFVDSFSSVN
jgi:5-methylcytosine-specific restriction endonuclease McrA